MKITDKLDEIEQVANAATEGPWVSTNPSDDTSEWYDEFDDPMVVTGDSEPGFYSQIAGEVRQGLDGGVADATFIADARTTVPTLVAALRAVVAVAEWHETKAYKATAFPGEGRDAEMRKAAQVHTEAARRIRTTLDAHLGGAA